MMSALGQKETCAVQNGASALPLKADIAVERATQVIPPSADRSQVLRDLAGETAANL